jgi:hypothetical protein
MREDLLGYLLSALDPHEMRRVDQRLSEEPQLREELAKVEHSLRFLDEAVAAEEVVEPPADLISRTLARIPDRELLSSHAAATGTVQTGAAIHPVAAPPSSARSSWGDLVVGALAVAALVALGLPTVARMRSQARNTACQDNLRRLGLAFSQYVLREKDAHLPQLAESGVEAFAGIYAVRLADSGLLSDASLRWCPDTELPRAEPQTTQRQRSEPWKARAEFAPVPQLVMGKDLKAAAQSGDVALLRWLQQVAGGHYAYSLGVVDENRYQAPQYEGRASFPILGDAPIAGHQLCDAVDVSKLRWSHGGRGANLLYEDGSVRHLQVSTMLGIPDHPFVNHRGSIEAGVNIDDASLATSSRPPFITARQR